MERSFTIIFSLLLLVYISGTAQDVSYSFANATTSNDGSNDYYEVDVMISTSSDFRLGSGQLYFDYNTAAFGNSIQTNGHVTITTASYILGQAVVFSIYNNFVANDNTTSRLSFSWQQAISSGCYTNNISATPTILFHLQIRYTAGGTAFPSNVCFTSGSSFDDQTFTACGPGGSCTFSDCGANAGTQITNDVFDCTLASLPVELLSFDVEELSTEGHQLVWETQTEINSRHFEVEKSTDGFNWQLIGIVEANGHSQVRKTYQFLNTDIQRHGRLYYRLKIVDWDEQYEYSDIRSIALKGGTAIQLYPNPVTAGQSLFVDLPLSKSRTLLWIELINNNGKVIQSKEWQRVNGHQFEWPMAKQLAAGVYFVRVRTTSNLLHVQKLTILR